MFLLAYAAPIPKTDLVSAICRVVTRIGRGRCWWWTTLQGLSCPTIGPDECSKGECCDRPEPHAGQATITSVSTIDADRGPDTEGESRAVLEQPAHVYPAQMPNELDTRRTKFIPAFSCW